jgi:TPR repeat protein
MSIIKTIAMVLLSLFLIGTHVQADTSVDSNKTDDAPFQPLTMYQEALDYLLGRNGKPRSAEKAAVLFKSLAEKNWSSAQHMLGNLYFRGKGVEKNNLLAYKWLSIASRDNAHLAAAIYDKRKLLQSKLSTSHLQQVEIWIDDWQPSQ